MVSKKRINELLELTIQIAQKAILDNNYPIGAILTDTEGNIISQSSNKNTTLNDVSAHAEILCLREARTTNTNKDNQKKFYLFCSLEPCYGCSFFIARTCITKIFSALKDPHKGGISDLKQIKQFDTFFNQIEIINEPSLKLKNQSQELMRNYFIKQGKPQTAEFYKNK